MAASSDRSSSYGCRSRSGRTRGTRPALNRDSPRCDIPEIGSGFVPASRLEADRVGREVEEVLAGERRGPVLILPPDQAFELLRGLGLILRFLARRVPPVDPEVAPGLRQEVPGTPLQVHRDDAGRARPAI